MADNAAAAQNTTEAATTGDQSGADPVTTALGGQGGEATTGDQGQQTGADDAASTNDDAASGNDGKATGDGGDDAKGKQGEDGKKGEEGDGKQAADPAPFDPAKLELPDGVQVDEKLLEQFVPLAKDLGLTQEQGQALIGMHTQALQSLREQFVKSFNDTVQGWAETAKTDKEIGGDKYAENVATAVKAIARFGTPELQAALNETGMGNHPELIRFCLRIGKAISEDAFGPDAGGAGGGETRSPADVLYDHPTSKKQ